MLYSYSRYFGLSISEYITAFSIEKSSLICSRSMFDCGRGYALYGLVLSLWGCRRCYRRGRLNLG